MLREVIKKNQIPVASSLVERSVELQYERLRQMLGMKPERGTAGLTDEMRDKMRPAGADEVRGQLLLEAIADKEGLTVTDEELAKHVENTAKSRNMAPAKLRAEWQRDGRSTTSRTRCARTRSSSSSSTREDHRGREAHRAGHAGAVANGPPRPDAR